MNQKSARAGRKTQDPAIRTAKLALKEKRAALTAERRDTLATEKAAFSYLGAPAGFRPVLPHTFGRAAA